MLGRSEQADSCAPVQLSSISGTTGFASVFSSDPMASSGDLTLSPKSNLNQFRLTVPISNLTGQGVLKGRYIEVGNGTRCGGNFGAFEKENRFAYGHQDNRFQESMVYYYGNLYQEGIDLAGYLVQTKPVQILAHCRLEDNAFFVRTRRPDGEFNERVCLGDSKTTPGAYYSDDAVVTLHELQHGATGDNYSLTHDLNQFWYDEAGALNEAISDFTSLMFTEAYIPMGSLVDPRVFSRWALGTFDPTESHARGAHKCPTYDPRFPECEQFPKFQVPTPDNGQLSSISYIYPDGVGWPYPNNFKGPDPVLEAYENFPSQEEIHNTGMVVLGALWDAYVGIKANHSANPQVAKKGMMQLVLESLRHLPAPNLKTNRSPVTFISFAQRLVTYSSMIPEFTGEDKAAIVRALKSRGLVEFQALDSPDWMGVGPGVNERISVSQSPGVYIQDDPLVLQKWLLLMGGRPSLVKQEASAPTVNKKLDPGEVAAIWFDIENQSKVTAGGVLVTATSKDPDLSFLDDSTNIGFLNLAHENQAQILYGKINGTGIVEALNPNGGSGSIPLGNSYFKTNPFFNRSWRTALWIKVSPNAAHGKVIRIEVQATPSNGVTSVKDFSVTIN